MLADTKPGTCFIVCSVASTSSCTSFCWFSGATVKTLTSVSTACPFAIVAIGPLRDAGSFQFGLGEQFEHRRFCRRMQDAARREVFALRVRGRPNALGGIGQ